MSSIHRQLTAAARIARTRFSQRLQAPTPHLQASPCWVIGSCSFSTAPPSEGRRKTPITVISGFLGAGKTSFLQNVLHSQTGLKFGLVVNDVANVNVDSKLIKQQTMGSKDGIDTLELQNGCVCCSLAEDLMTSVAKLVAIADAKKESYDHIVVECSGVAEPRKIRDLFQEAELGNSPLMQVMKLDTLITLVDAKVFMNLFGSERVIGDSTELAFQPGDLLTKASFEKDGTAMRKVTELLLEQVECADSVLINKCDLLQNEQEVNLVKRIVKSINPTAITLPCTRGKVTNPLLLIGTAQGLGAAGRDILREQKNLVDHVTEKEECAVANCNDPSHHHDHKHEHDHDHATCTDPTHNHDHSHSHSHDKHTTAEERFGITSFVYRRRVPFHPVRFSQFLQGIGKISMKGVDDMTVYDLAQAGKAKAEQGTVDAAKQLVLRSKGFVWMGVSRSAAYYMSHAGQFLELAVLGRWWADIKKESWPEGVKVEEITVDFEGPHGDRRQELVFIGQFGLDDGKSRKTLETALDNCLLTAEEMKGYEKHSALGDPALRDYFFPN